MEFKDRIKELRSNENISAIELAKKLSKSESAIRMWETGKAKPDADTLTELSALFDCSVDYLLGLSDFKSEKEAEKFFSSESTLLSLLEDMPFKRKKRFIYRMTGLINSMEYFSSNSNPNEKTDNLVFDGIIEIMSVLSGLYAVVGACSKEIKDIKDVEIINKCIFVRARQLEKGKKAGISSLEYIYKHLSNILIHFIPEDDFKRKLIHSSRISFYNDLEFEEDETNGEDNPSDK